MARVLDHYTAPFRDHYTVTSQIGQSGQFGTAYICIHRVTNERFAVKVIKTASITRVSKNKSKLMREFAREIEILQRLNHKNIIRFHEVFEDRECLYIVMDLCTGGELFDRIQARGAYSEKEAARVLRQITEAVSYLHKNKIAHCDLKPDNFLFETPDESSTLKVIDFGMSKFVQRRKYHRKICGTPYYVAPEVLVGHYNEGCDMWSIGVVMFVMLFGYPPFWADPERYGPATDEMIFHLIRKGFSPVTKPGCGAYFPSNHFASDSAKDLISKLLKSNIAERLTAEEALEHPWLMGTTASETPIEVGVLKSLKQFNAKNKFKLGVLNAMSHILSDEQVNSLKAAFKKLDKDNDGTVTAEELRAVFKDLSADEINAIIDNADIDGDGKLSYEELLAATVYRKINAKEERLLELFQSIDKDGNGSITAEELSELLPGSDTISLIREVDKNGDGVIDYEEFLVAWEDAQVVEK